MDRTVVIGSDHAGFALKDTLKGVITDLGREVVDVGTDSLASCDYPVYAFRVCDLVLEKGCLGILICGSGLGMSMAANRRKGIRAALCANEWMARATRQHNDANVLCLGERWVGVSLAEAIARVFLTTDFEGGRHQRRIDLIDSNL